MLQEPVSLDRCIVAAPATGKVFTLEGCQTLHDYELTMYGFCESLVFGCTSSHIGKEYYAYCRTGNFSDVKTLANLKKF